MILWNITFPLFFVDFRVTVIQNRCAIQLQVNSHQLHENYMFQSPVTMNLSGYSIKLVGFYWKLMIAFLLKI